MSDEEGIGLLFGGQEEEEEEEEEEPEIWHDEYTRTGSSKHAPELIKLKLALVKKHHSLWGEYVYNAARVVSDYIDNGTIPVLNKTVLELGAGAGLPALMAALNQASGVVITDYGRCNDRSLILAIDLNIQMLKSHISQKCTMKGAPYVWGQPIDGLQLEPTQLFDVVLLADCIFNRSEHRNLLKTIKMCLAQQGTAYCSFSHHDPHKKELDLVFLKLAESEFDLKCTFLSQEQRVAYPFQVHWFLANNYTL